MRFLSTLLLTCILFLSAFGGIVKPAQVKVDDCCKNIACHHKPGQKQQSGNGCDQPNCPMMFSCSSCGFLTGDSLVVGLPRAKSLPKPVAHYIPGDLAAYHANNWKPPQAC
jgi:hypothetical protein